MRLWRVWNSIFNLIFWIGLFLGNLVISYFLFVVFPWVGVIFFLCVVIGFILAVITLMERHYDKVDREGRGYDA
jgi:CHASE2 domain-containing sensor protein